MKPLLHHTRTALALALAASALSACVVAPYPQSGAIYDQAVPTYDGYYAAQPAPYPEVIPVSPYAGAIWIGGNWGYSGGRRQWTPGRWDHPSREARPGYQRPSPPQTGPREQLQPNRNPRPDRGPGYQGQSPSRADPKEQRDRERNRAPGQDRNGDGVPDGGRDGGRDGRRGGDGDGRR